MVLSSSDIQHNSTIVGTYYVPDLLLSTGDPCVHRADTTGGWLHEPRGGGEDLSDDHSKLQHR